MMKKIQIAHMETKIFTVCLILILCACLPIFIFALHKPPIPPTFPSNFPTTFQDRQQNIPKGWGSDGNKIQHRKENGKEELQEKMKGEKEEDITQEMPKGEFIFPKEKKVIKNTIKVRFRIEGASGVEFYLRRPQSLVETYLGSASLQGNEIWEFEWETTKTPNGQYFLIPKITSDYGNYKGASILIEINNEIKREKEVIDKIAQKLEEQHKEIKKAEEKVEKEKKDVKETIEKQIEEVFHEVEKIAEEVVEKPKKEKVKLEIEKKKEEIREKIEKNIQKAVEAKNKEEREQVKKEIQKAVEEIAKPVVEQARPERKQEIIKVGSEIKKEVEKTLEKVDKIAETRKLVEERRRELFSQDRDKDGIPDFEELRLGTDPLNPDTDNDGFLDGSEIKLGFDPTKPSPADKIKFQEPIKVKAKISKTLKVEKVEIQSKKEKKVLVIKGKALPNTFVTIYIYSLPIIVITKADVNGNWEYVLDKPLLDGQHKIYVARTDNKGDIEEVSEPFVFAKTQDKIIRLLEPSKEKPSPAKILQRSFAILIFGVIFFALGLAFTIVGLLLRSKKFPK